MLRIAAIMAMLALASCGLMSREPKAELLARCLAIAGPGGNHPLNVKLGQLVEAVKWKGWQINWRRPSEDRYTMQITGEGANGLPLDIRIAFQEGTTSPEPVVCNQPSLAITGGALGDESMISGVAESTVLGLIKAYADALPQRDEPVQAAPEPEANPSASDPSAPASPPAGATVARIFQRELLNATVSYLESISGPAFEVYGNVRIYKVEGCDVIALTDGGQVNALGMRSMNDQCNFDMRRFLPDLPANPSYEELKVGLDDGAWRATCLIECGNAVAPTTFFQARAASRNADLEVVAHGPGTPQLWYAALSERYGEAWIHQGKFNCPDINNMPVVPMLSLGNQRPHTLIVGRGMIQGGCRIPRVDILSRE